jgi:hypothetical protein
MFYATISWHGHDFPMSEIVLSFFKRDVFADMAWTSYRGQASIKIGGDPEWSSSLIHLKGPDGYI